MDHVEALNKMLSHQCPSNEHGDGHLVFRFDMCCDGVAEIKVRPLGNSEYEILDIRLAPYSP